MRADAELSGRSCKRGAAGPRKSHGCAFAKKRLHDCRADAARASGDKRHLVLQPLHDVDPALILTARNPEARARYPLGGGGTCKIEASAPRRCAIPSI